MLFPLDTVSPSLVVRESMTILLEQRVDTRDTAIPRVFEILERETSVLSVRLLALQSVLGPDSSRIEELCLPRLYVTEQVGNETRERGYSSASREREEEQKTDTSEFPPPIPARKWVIPVSVCFDQRKSEAGMRMCPIESMPRPPNSAEPKEKKSDQVCRIVSDASRTRP